GWRKTADVAAVLDMLKLALARTQWPWRTVPIETWLHAATVEPGDIIRATAREGLNVGGWTNRFLQVRSVSPNMSGVGRVSIKAHDLRVGERPEYAIQKTVTSGFANPSTTRSAAFRAVPRANEGYLVVSYANGGVVSSISGYGATMGIGTSET